MKNKINSNRTKKSPVTASILRTIRTHKANFILMVIMIALSVITALLPPLVLEKCVNDLAQKKTISFFLAFTYMILIILSDLMEMGQNTWITIFGQKITHGLRSSLAAKLNLLPSNYYTSHSSGQMASVFVNDSDTIDSLFSNGIVGMFADVIKLISILGIIFTRSLGLGIVLLIITPVLFFITRVFQKRTLAAQKNNRRAIAKVNNHVPESIRNIRMIHVLHKEHFMETKYDEYISESYDAVNRSNFNDSVYSPIIIMTQAVVIAVLMLGAVQGKNMQAFFGLSVGSAVAVISYVGKIFGPLESIGMEIQNIQGAMAGISHINEFLQEEERKDTCSDNASKKGIVFDNVTFGYRADSPILQDYSFEIKRGENVTFIGRTGAGKSTIFKLLMGLYDPQNGTVTIDGIAPTHIKAEDKRKVFGVVEQDFHIVNGTVRDQITLFDPQISDDMVWQALKSVKLADVVKNLENGLDEEMKDELFSKGQNQLLSIARAVVLSPEILLLDEITANLDSETETQILEALDNACQGRTVLSISHRYSKMMKNQRQIVIDNSIKA